MSLYLTKTRAQLLRDVDDDLGIDGSVSLDDNLDGHVWLVQDYEAPRKVTARIGELEKAGWVEQHEAFWRLTAEGERVLTEWESRQSNE